MKVKTSKLVGTALDWAVAKCLGYNCDIPPWASKPWLRIIDPAGFFYCAPEFSIDWAASGPIIEQEHITISVDHSGMWLAWNGFNYADSKEHMQCDRSPLIAAMRCYVASNLGNEIEVPDQLREILT